MACSHMFNQVAFWMRLRAPKNSNLRKYLVHPYRAHRTSIDPMFLPCFILWACRCILLVYNGWIHTWSHKPRIESNDIDIHGRTNPAPVQWMPFSSQACGWGGCWERAVSLLDDMRSHQLTPDELTYRWARMCMCTCMCT